MGGNGDIKAEAYYVCVSGHEAVDVVVDLLEDKPSVHEGKTALVKTNNGWVYWLIQDTWCVFFVFKPV